MLPLAPLASFGIWVSKLSGAKMWIIHGMFLQVDIYSAIAESGPIRFQPAHKARRRTRCRLSTSHVGLPEAAT